MMNENIASNHNVFDPEAISLLNPSSIIYVLSRTDNSSISKIGSTEVSAQSRAQNYTDGDWSVFFEIEVPSAVKFSVERFAQRILKSGGYWLDPKISGGTATEVFLCEAKIAMNAVQKAWVVVRQETLLQMGIPVEVSRKFEEKSSESHIFIKSISEYAEESKVLEKKIKELEMYILKLNKALAAAYSGHDYHGRHKSLLDEKDQVIEQFKEEITDLKKKNASELASNRAKFKEIYSEVIKAREASGLSQTEAKGTNNAMSYEEMTNTLKYFEKLLESGIERKV